MTALELLTKYWGHTAFRSAQAQIIESVAQRTDTLVLLPTGGGKSLCFQIPALMRPGLCLVVSPLLALMRDQVQALNSRGITALSITSENSPKQSDDIFERCAFDPAVKFLYLSPERLVNENTRARLAELPINLLAVDEAHCISEWGYDFRPPYLRIAEIRPILGKVPVVALTASATPPVVADIQNKLNMHQPAVFVQSFAREKLAYFVEYTDDKLGTAIKVAHKLRGSGIVYMRSRKGTERVARVLRKTGLSIDFYHAGLDSEQRRKRQEAWSRGEVKIMAATNAFGMGIDKPDVRFVLHFDLPDTLENYYQECGRGGRDGNKAFAVALLAKSDVSKLREKLLSGFPSIEQIQAHYRDLCFYLQVPMGGGLGEVFPFDLHEFASRFKHEPRAFAHSLRFLERDGYIQLSDRADGQAKARMIAHPSAVRSRAEEGDAAAMVLETLLRSYTRLFDEDTVINLPALAKRAGMTTIAIQSELKKLHLAEVIHYQPASALPRISFTVARIDERYLYLSPEHYALRKHVVLEKGEAMMAYAENSEKCRSRLITEYFGEPDAPPCGICDNCLFKKSLVVN